MRRQKVWKVVLHWCTHGYYAECYIGDRENFYTPKFDVELDALRNAVAAILVLGGRVHHTYPRSDYMWWQLLHRDRPPKELDAFMVWIKGREQGRKVVLAGVRG